MAFIHPCSRPQTGYSQHGLIPSFYGRHRTGSDLTETVLSSEMASCLRPPLSMLMAFYTATRAEHPRHLLGVAALSAWWGCRHLGPFKAARRLRGEPLQAQFKGCSIKGSGGSSRHRLGPSIDLNPVRHVQEHSLLVFVGPLGVLQLPRVPDCHLEVKDGPIRCDQFGPGQA